MTVANPLSTEFIQRYPRDAARVLEDIRCDDVAALLNEMASESAASVLAAMLPDHAGQIIVSMDDDIAAQALLLMPPSHAARIYRLLDKENQQAVSKFVPAKYMRQLRHFIDYVSLSAGDLMDANVPMLPATISIAEAIRRIERQEHVVACEIYVVDNDHRILGQVELGKLLISNHQIQLKEIMNSHVPFLAAHASAEALLSHPGWQKRLRMPVVERDNTLIGVLEYGRLQEVIVPGERTYRGNNCGLASLLSLYWLSLIQLLDSLFSMAGAGKGEKG